MRTLLFLFLISPLLAEITLYTENEPPFSMKVNLLKSNLPEDPITGISVEILQSLFGRLKMAVIMKMDNWDKGYAFTLKNISQGIFSTARTKEWENLFKWIGPLVVNDWVLVGKESFNENIRKISDPLLKKLRIGSLRAGAISAFLKLNGLNVSNFENAFECVLALKENRIDLWATGEPVARYFANEIAKEKINVVLLLKKHQFLYLAMSKKTPDELIEKLNRELGRMRRDGTYKAIYAKYQGYYLFNYF